METSVNIGSIADRCVTLAKLLSTLSFRFLSSNVKITSTLGGCGSSERKHRQWAQQMVVLSLLLPLDLHSLPLSFFLGTSCHLDASTSRVLGAMLEVLKLGLYLDALALLLFYTTGLLW